MWTPPSSLAIPALVALLGGCQLLVTFEDVPEGTAGGGGEGATGGQGGATTTGGQSGATTTTTPIDCATSGDCPDLGICAVATCSLGTCMYTHTPAGTLVSDPSPTDCIRMECDGAGHATSVPDDDDAPDEDPTDCMEKVCSQGAVLSETAPDGTLCGTLPMDECKQQVCASGACELENKPDGTPFRDPYPNDCAKAECYMGDPYFFGGINGMCGADPDPDNCSVPFCNVSTLPATCTSSFSASGTACKKPGGAPGTCDAAGVCQ